MPTHTEADVEQAALDWLAGLGWSVRTGRRSRRTQLGRSAGTTAMSCWSADFGTLLRR